MTQSATVTGPVEFRAGDGPKLPIPQGPIDVEAREVEVTLSWVDGDTHGAATLPIAEFRRYVSEGAIRMQA